MNRHEPNYLLISLEYFKNWFNYQIWEENIYKYLIIALEEAKLIEYIIFSRKS